MEQQKKNFEIEIRNMKHNMSEEIEDLTGMFSSSSKELCNLTIANRELQSKFD